MTNVRDTEPNPAPLARIVVGLGVVWALFQALAAALHSMRGEAGLLVAAAVIAALLVVERALFATSPRAAASALGLGRPPARALLVGGAIATLMLAYFPLWAALSDTRLSLVPHAGWLAVGMLAQGGLAEETLFRGYLFRRIRAHHPFWRAAWLSMVPFTAVHLLLFASLPPAIAAASVLLAVVTSFPLARLFDLGGGNVWAPALVHAAIQSIKLVQPAGGGGPWFALGWMLVSALVPLLVFAVGHLGDRGGRGP